MTPARARCARHRVTTASAGDASAPGKHATATRTASNATLFWMEELERAREALTQLLQDHNQWTANWTAT